MDGGQTVHDVARFRQRAVRPCAFLEPLQNQHLEAQLRGQLRHDLPLPE